MFSEFLESTLGRLIDLIASLICYFLVAITVITWAGIVLTVLISVAYWTFKV